MKLKSFIYIFLILLLIAGIIFIPSSIINIQTNGLTYDDVSSVPKSKIGLVLGCPKKLSGGRDNIYFTNRINAAVNLYKAGKVEYLLVTGDNISRGCSETISMRADLIKNGVPEDKIFCDFKGMRTLDSIIRAKKVFGQDNLLIISQEFHNRRAIFIAKHHGINAIGFNAVDVDFSEGVWTHLRDILSRIRAVLDVYILKSQPKYNESLAPGGHNEDTLRKSCEIK